MGMTIEIPEGQEFEKAGAIAIAEMQSLRIVSHEDYLSAGENLKKYKSMASQVKMLFKDAKESANKAHKAVCAAEKKLLDPIDLAITNCSGKVGQYLLEKERREKAEQDRIRREAEERARVEREALEKKMQEERLNTAIELEAQGFKSAADDVLNQPIVAKVQPVITPVVFDDEEKVQGIHGRKDYKARVVDLMALVKAVAAGKHPISFLMANESALNLQAKSLKLEMRIDGVEVVESVSVVARGGRL